MSVHKDDANDSTVPLEDREAVKQPCAHVSTDIGERLVPVEQLEATLRDMAVEIREGIDSHEETFVFVRPADEFDPDGPSPLDRID